MLNKKMILSTLDHKLNAPRLWLLASLINRNHGNKPILPGENVLQLWQQNYSEVCGTMSLESKQ